MDYTKVSKKYLAQDMKVSLKTIYNWFSGKHTISTKELDQMSQILKVDINDLNGFFISKNKEFKNEHTKM